MDKRNWNLNHIVSVPFECFDRKYLKNACGILKPIQWSKIRHLFTHSIVWITWSSRNRDNRILFHRKFMKRISFHRIYWAYKPRSWDAISIDWMYFTWIHWMNYWKFSNLDLNRRCTSRWLYLEIAFINIKNQITKYFFVLHFSAATFVEVNATIYGIINCSKPNNLSTYVSKKAQITRWTT